MTYLEKVVKEWVDQRVDEISKCKTGISYKYNDIENTQNFIKIAQKYSDDLYNATVELYEGPVFSRTTYIFPGCHHNIKDHEKWNMAEDFAKIFPALVRDSKLNYLLEFKKFCLTLNT